VAEQILGRIFNPYLNCKVYEIKKNEEQMKTILEKNLSFSDEDFRE
jgi:hypothetical protein